VVKHVITEEKAAAYVDRMYKWLESFGTGFKADDKTTWHVDQMPAFSKWVIRSVTACALALFGTRIGWG
jgi:hypothetical protein